MSGAHSQRLPVRLFNRAARTLAAFGVRPAPFSVDSLLERARKASGGLDDLGDPSCLDGLRVLVDAYERESNLNPFGRMMIRGELSGILASRLSVVAAWKRDPAVLRGRIERPIFVLGLPRTGTTALHDLIAQDPANQALDYWLASAPGPRPPAEAVASDPRFARAKQFLRITYYLDPSLRAIHNLTPEGPDECRHLLQESFTDDTFDSNATIPSYTAWYASRDMRASYAHHRDVLKLVQSSCPERRWVLKYPAHMAHLHVLLETYPDAHIVFTHRDPAQVLPSLCSLVGNWRGIYEDDVDRRALGSWQLEMWAKRLQHAIDVRRGSDPARFYDLHFRDLLGDPVATVKRMYAHFGIELSPEREARLRAWQRDHPRGQFGEHRYRADEYGLSKPRIWDRFAGYLQHFGIEREE
jgi:hypothetical protein